ncbi:MAG: hypothetical protein AAFR28_16915 [Pseudomonadota bacterium]
MLDLNSTSAAEARIIELIDEACAEQANSQTPRDYLGGSRLGEKCERKLFYEVTKAPRKPIPGRLARIFDRGHTIEDRVAEWLRLAGFDLRIRNKAGKQFAFDDVGGRLRGHVDGVIVSGPDVMAYPALWENKVLNIASFREVKNHGVRKSKPVYAGQIATYQGYMKLADNPALLTVVSADTMEIVAELVPFDAALAQECIDRGVRVLDAVDGDCPPPRIAAVATSYHCRFCDFSEHCWGEGDGG